MNRRRALMMAAKGGAVTECFIKYGNPVIVDGILQTTNTNDYITMDRAFDPGDAPWEFVLCLERTQKVGAYQIIIDSDGIRLRTPWQSDNVKWYLAHSSQWDIDDGSVTISCELGSKKWLKLTYDNGTYIYYRSTDGTTFTEIVKKTGKSTIKASTIRFGTTNSYADFDLNETYIKVNGSMFWKPYM